MTFLGIRNFHTALHQGKEERLSLGKKDKKMDLQVNLWKNLRHLNVSLPTVNPLITDVFFALLTIMLNPSTTKLNRNGEREGLLA